MRKTKIFLEAIVVITVVLALVLPTSAVVTNTSSKKNQQSFEGAKRIYGVPQHLTNLPTAASPGSNVLLSVNSPEDDHLPDITRDGNGNIVVTYVHEESILEGQIYLLWSTDNGVNWDGRLLDVFEGVCSYPQVAFCQGSKYEESEWDGIWIECFEVMNEGGYFGLMPDITDDTTWELYGWNEGSRPGTTCLNFEDDMWYKQMSFDNKPGPIIAMINDDQGMNQGIELWWEASGDQLGSIVYNWDAGGGPLGNYEPCNNIIDTAPIHDGNPAWTDDDFFYIIAQSNSEPKSKLVYKRVVPTIEDDQEFVEDQLFLDGGEYDAANPTIDASGDNVVVVYMSNENGDWDIKCMYSSDRGQNWDSSMVAAQSGVDELYPAIYMSGNTVKCIYIKEGNLYLVTSEDGGVNWGDPVQVNEVDGTVVEEQN
ncbi:MAG: sialidase family protein, partial [Candidatus Thorarchaeota archaeon]